MDDRSKSWKSLDWNCFFFAGGNSLLDNCALGYPSRIRSEITCSQWQILIQSMVVICFAFEVRGKATGFRKFFAKTLKTWRHLWCLGWNPSEGIYFLKMFFFFFQIFCGSSFYFGGGTFLPQYESVWEELLVVVWGFGSDSQRVPYLAHLIYTFSLGTLL